MHDGQCITVPLSCLATPADGTVQVQGTVQSVPAEMFVDTGSCVTLLSTHFVNTKLSSSNVRLSITPISSVLTAVNGSVVPVVGESTVELVTGNLTVRHRVIVADITPDVLIGIDFLRSHGCQIDFGRNVLSAGGRDVPLEPTSNKYPSVCRVHLAHSVTVPPYAQVLVPAQIHANADESVPTSAGYVSPSAKFISKYSTAMAGVVTTPDASGRVWVRLQNFMPRTTTIPRNYEIAEFDTDISIDSDTDTAPQADGGKQACNAVNETNSIPSRPEELFQLDHLAPTEKAAVSAVLNENTDVISLDPFDLGKTDVVTHEIHTTSEIPKRQPPRRIPIHQRTEVQTHIEQLVDNGIITPSQSPWAAPIVVVRKPDSTIRLCIDYRQLNSITEKDAFPLPRVDDAIDAMAGARYFSTLDLAAGYWQVEVDEAAKSKSAFVTPFGLFEWNRMPFGLCNAPSTFQRLMNRVLGDLVPSICLVYLDDIIVFSSSIEEHLKYAAIQDWPTPKSLTEVRSFVGFASYYRRFVPNFSEIVEPLNRLSQKNAIFNWTDECHQAFAELKVRLTKPPILAYPDPKRRFILDTDASNLAMGAVLSQLDEQGQEVVVSYASKTLSKSQRNMGSTKKELLAVVTFTAYFRHYVRGAQFTLGTDHKALLWLHSFREVDGLLARWIERLAVFDYTIVHRPGKQHVNADALSRIGASEEVSTPACDELPGEPSTVINQITETASTEPRLEPDVTHMIGWQEAFLDRPLRSDSTMKSASLTLLRLWSQWKRLRLINGVLYRVYHPENCNTPYLQFIVPRSLQCKMLDAVHADVSGGHLGIERTLDKLRKRCYWPFMLTAVTDYCKTCDICESRKTPAPTARAPLIQDDCPSFPLEKVAIDIMGPLPTTARGNRYIVVVCDYFTKWPEAFAVPNIQIVELSLNPNSSGKFVICWIYENRERLRTDPRVTVWWNE